MEISLPSFATIKLGLQAAASIVKLMKRPKGLPAIVIDAADAENAIADHAKVAYKWSSAVHMRGKVRLTEEILVKPSIHVGDSRKQLADVAGLNPQQLMAAGKSFVLLGGPGAGKTTLLKSLSLALQTTPAAGASDRLQMPVMIRLRDLQAGEALCEHITKALGIRVEYERGSSEDQKPTNAGKLFLESTRERVLAAFLDRTRSLLLLDGLDEVHHEDSTRVTGEIQRLHGLCEQSACIVSCRHGAYLAQIEGMPSYTVSEFTWEQVQEFCAKWFDNDGDKSRRFLTQLRQKPYAEIARVPLHATNLCMIFDEIGDLPPDHTSIHAKIIDIRVRQWDLDRGIVRVSTVSGLDPTERYRFLAAIAYELAKRGAHVTFGIEDFRAALDTVCPKFKFAVQSPRNFLDELEAQTGLVYYSGFEKHDFFHKTIQEHLCGEHLSRLPILSAYSAHLFNMPDACGVATQLSGDREAFVWGLANVLAMPLYIAGRSYENDVGFWTQYWRRLSDEKCTFMDSKILAVGLLLPLTVIVRSDSVSTTGRGLFAQVVRDLGELKGVRESVRDLLRQASVEPEPQKMYGLVWRNVSIRAGAFVASEALGTVKLPHSLVVPGPWIGP